MKALVTGATGFIGAALLRRLSDPVVLSRDPDKAARVLGLDAFLWDPEESPPPAEAFVGVDTVFHLAGEPLAPGRWTAAKKARIRSSRVAGTRNLVETLASLKSPPRVLVSSSAVGYYGSRGDEILSEASPPGDGFLASLCVDWENEASRARESGLRVVTVRTGVVLGAGGGALAQMLPLFKLGLGGRLGRGTQWLSWIHIDDLVQSMLFAAAAENLDGPVNAVSPDPVTNADFTRALAAAVRRPAFLPAPAVMLRLALGEMATALLSSQRTMPAELERLGFRFSYTEVEAALRAAIAAGNAAPSSR